MTAPDQGRSSSGPRIRTWVSTVQSRVSCRLDQPAMWYFKISIKLVICGDRSLETERATRFPGWPSFGNCQFLGQLRGSGPSVKRCEMRGPPYLRLAAPQTALVATHWPALSRRCFCCIRMVCSKVPTFVHKGFSAPLDPAAHRKQAVMIRFD